MRTAFCTLIAVGVAASAQAAAPNVTWEDEKTPTTEESVRTRKIADGKKVENCWGWVAYEGFAPRAAPKKDAAPSGADPLRFLQTINRLYDAHQTDDVYTLIASGEVGTAKLTILGWVPTRYVVRSNNAIQEPKSSLYVKAMVLNPTEYVRKTKSLVSARVHLAPDPASPSSGEFRFFKPYFVYAESGSSPEEGYYLLGESVSFNYPSAVALPTAVDVSGIVGWVDKRRVCLWQTRECLMWDPDPARGAPVPAYKTLADAEQAALGRPVATDTSEAPFVGGKPVPWAHDQPRYPVLPVGLPDGTSVPYREFAGNRIRKIAFIGAVVDDQGRVLGDSAKRTRITQLVAQYRAQVERTELLFVMDDSVSMDPWFGRTAQAVDEIIRLVDRDGRKLRVGFAYYADVPPEDRADPQKLAAAVRTAPEPAGAAAEPLLKEVGGAGFRAALNDLKQKAAEKKTRYGGEPREQVFLGLRTAVARAGFSPWARKIVILIGDNGDHDRDAGGTATAERTVAQMLSPPGQAPIELYALHVRQLTQVEDADWMAFSTQAKTIGRLLQERVDSHDAAMAKELGTTARKRKPLSEVFVVRDSIQDAGADEFGRRITERYAELTAAANEIDRDLRSIDTGQFTSMAEFRNPDILAMIREMKDEDVDLRVLANGVQLFEYRYVLEQNPTNKATQTRPQLFISSGELKQVIDGLSAFYGDPNEQPTVAGLAERIANLQVGEGDARQRAAAAGGCGSLPLGIGGNPAAEFLLKLDHFNFQNALLKAARKQLNNESFTDSRDLFQKMLHKRYLLEDIREGQRYEYEGSVRKGTARKDETTRRGFYLDKANKFAEWFYLDYEAEWP